MPQTIDNMSVTWTNSLTTYTGIKLNAAGSSDANSAAASLLMDLQVGGSSRFSVDKAGNIRTGINGSGNYLSLGPTTTGDATAYSAGFQLIGNAQVSLFFGGTEFVRFNGSGSRAQMLDTGAYSWGSSGTTGPDLFLTRRAAANLRLGAADAAGSAIAINSVASNQLTLASNHGLTTGAAIIITGSVAPSGTTLNTRYYARVIAAAVIELYSTYDQATAASGTTGIIAVTTAGTSASVRLATPFQSFGVQDFTGTDIPGQPFIIRGSRGTGTGPGGDLIFQVAPAGSSGTAQNALATALTIGADRNATFGGNIVVAGGAVTRPFSSGSGASALNILSTHVGLSGIIEGSNNVATFGFGNSTNTHNGLFITQSGYFGWYTFDNTAPDLRLFRDAANTLALRNGANAQEFNIYRTYTSDSAYERFSFSWAQVSNVALIQTLSVGGTSRDIHLQAGGGNFVLRNTNLTFVTDNANDIGTSTGSRPRNVYASSAFVTSGGSTVGTDISVGAARAFYWVSGAALYSTGAGILAFEGRNSSFPALKRNSTALETKLADDSAYAPHAMQYLDVTDGVTAPASATGRARIYVDTADGDLKVIFADGTVKTIVTDT